MNWGLVQYHQPYKSNTTVVSSSLFKNWGSEYNLELGIHCKCNTISHIQSNYCCNCINSAVKNWGSTYNLELCNSKDKKYNTILVFLFMKWLWKSEICMKWSMKGISWTILHAWNMHEKKFKVGGKWIQYEIIVWKLHDLLKYMKYVLKLLFI